MHEKMQAYVEREPYGQTQQCPGKLNGHCGQKKTVLSTHFNNSASDYPSLNNPQSHSRASHLYLSICQQYIQTLAAMQNASLLLAASSKQSQRQDFYCRLWILMALT